MTPPGQDTTRARPADARWALAGLSLAMLLSSLGTSIANVGLPAMGEAFDASFAQVQWIVLAYLLASTTLVVGVGRLGDIIGRRRLLVAGIALFTAASVLCGATTSLWLLVAARAVQGLGAAAMLALSMALVGEAVPKARTGSAMGLLGTMSAIGTALGPSLGGVLLAGFGWPALFLVNLPLGVAAMGLVLRHLPADRPMRAAELAGFDRRGTLLLALALSAYALAMTIGRGNLGVMNLALLAVALAAAGLFLLAERRAAFPLLRPAMVRDRTLRAGLSTGLLVATVMMATLVVGPFHLSRALGLDAASLGLAMSAGPLVAALSGVPAGRLVDHFGARRIILLGLASMAGGTLGLALAPIGFGITGYVAPLVVTTAGYALFQAANNTAVMVGVGPDQRGVVSGLLNLSRNLGLITGASAMGVVFALGSGAADLMTAGPAAVAAGTRMTFAAATVLIAVALAIAAAGRQGGAPALAPETPKS